MRRSLAYAAFAFALAASPVAFAASNNPAEMPAGTYALDKTHASITAQIDHFGFSGYTFRFEKFDASYTYDPAKPEASVIKVTVDVNSLSTGYDKADAAFPAEFLAADKHPTATFVSKSITRSGGNKGVVAGDLTLAGVTKPVSLDVTFNNAGKDMFGAIRSGFAASTVIKRGEFGSTKYAPALGDEVKLMIDVEFTKQ
ncbi:YceI family protein [Caulobacter segnis]|uniref:YceI family protein n=1 Tax=Caulobacter segnis TaxID=88688 RepID=UPI0024107151|nr:YceI family protein [Caulobacter segnis]MDG2521084.1 YceI family protein [Caulobacter segnis]